MAAVGRNFCACKKGFVGSISMIKHTHTHWEGEKESQVSSRTHWFVFNSEIFWQLRSFSQAHGFLCICQRVSGKCVDSMACLWYVTEFWNVKIIIGLVGMSDKKREMGCTGVRKRETGDGALVWMRDTWYLHIHGRAEKNINRISKIFSSE